jgi:hypothetical protein
LQRPVVSIFPNGGHNVRLLSCKTPKLAWLSASLWASCIALTCCGCYDGQALVEAARSTALKTRTAEVDFGLFQTTLPRDPNTQSFTDVRLYIFWTVPRYRVPEIELQLKAEQYRVRHETLQAVRTTTPDELAEPSLTQLRERIEQVVNEILAESPVKSIGFYEVSLRQR